MDGIGGDLVTTLMRRAWSDLIVDRFRLWWVRVDGVEVTQAIQYYKSSRHLTDPGDRGPDNSVRLVAGKPAWVRVYVRSGLFPLISRISGTLHIERRVLGFLWTSVSTLNANPPGSVVARSSIAYTTERGSVANTLNFVVPADQFHGVLRLTVRLTDNAGQVYDTESMIVDATLRQTLRLRGILVSYNGPSTANTVPGQPPPPNVTFAAPTLADLQATADRALRAMPVQSAGVFSSAGTLAWNLPLDDPRLSAGGCSTNWNLLLAALTNQRVADGNRTDVVYYGLLPAGIPLLVPGCGQGGLGSAATGDQTTLLHEIGHGYGFQHTPCGAAGSTDPAYPTYEPYAAASIGEYGLDISNGNVLTPQAYSDYMSYCFPQWMSLYQHGRLILHPRLDPRWERDELYLPEYLDWRQYLIPDYIPDPPPDPWRWSDMRPERLISLTGIVSGDGQVQVLTVARVEAAPRTDGRETQLTARLLGENGRVLAQAPLVRLNARGGGCGNGCGEDDDITSYPFQAVLPDVERGEALVIMAGEEERWTRRAPDEVPRVGGVAADVDEEGTLYVRWELSAGESPEVWVQWSSDQGRSWRGLATGLTGDSARLDLGGLPPGDLEMRVLAHDGFSTATSEPVRVRVPDRAPEIAILHPSDGQTLIAGMIMRLWAAISAPGGGPVEASCTWILDGETVADSDDAWIEAPTPGSHRLTLTVRSAGGEVDSTVSFTTVAARPDEHAAE